MCVFGGWSRLSGGAASRSWVTPLSLDHLRTVGARGCACCCLRALGFEGPSRSAYSCCYVSKGLSLWPWYMLATPPQVGHSQCPSLCLSVRHIYTPKWCLHCGQPQLVCRAPLTSVTHVPAALDSQPWLKTCSTQTVFHVD